MDADRHKRIEQRAYAFWQLEGQPQGKHDEHWLLAARQIEAEDSGRSAAKPKRRRNGRSSARKKSKK
jgi:hypothetical protein